MNISDRLKKLLNQPQAIQPGRVLNFARARQGVTVRTSEGDKQAIAATDISTNDVTLLRDQSGQYWAIASQKSPRTSTAINGARIERFLQTRGKSKRPFIPVTQTGYMAFLYRIVNGDKLEFWIGGFLANPIKVAEYNLLADEEAFAPSLSGTEQDIEDLVTDLWTPIKIIEAEVDANATSTGSGTHRAETDAVLELVQGESITEVLEAIAAARVGNIYDGSEYQSVRVINWSRQISEFRTYTLLEASHPPVVINLAGDTVALGGSYEENNVGTVRTGSGGFISIPLGGSVSPEFTDSPPAIGISPGLLSFSFLQTTGPATEQIKIFDANGNFFTNVSGTIAGTVSSFTAGNKGTRTYSGSETRQGGSPANENFQVWQCDVRQEITINFDLEFIPRGGGTPETNPPSNNPDSDTDTFESSLVASQIYANDDTNNEFARTRIVRNSANTLRFKMAPTSTQTGTHSASGDIRFKRYNYTEAFISAEGGNIFVTVKHAGNTGSANGFDTIDFYQVNAATGTVTELGSASVQDWLSFFAADAYESQISFPDTTTEFYWEQSELGITAYDRTPSTPQAWSVALNASQEGLGQSIKQFMQQSPGASGEITVNRVTYDGSVATESSQTGTLYSIGVAFTAIDGVAIAVR